MNGKYYRFHGRLYKTSNGLIRYLLKFFATADEAGVDDDGKWYVAYHGHRMSVQVETRTVGVQIAQVCKTGLPV